MRKYFIINKNGVAINSIKKTMEGFDSFQYIGISDNYNNAMNTVLKENPTLVFIDIDHTITKPFQFVNDVNLYSENLIDFIAISYEKCNAYNAIKLGFCDFLLNPITDLEIRKTILNFQKKKCIKKRNSICLKSYKDYQYLNVDEILFLKADNNTTEIHMNDNRIVNAFEKLKSFEKRLPNYFLRIHKSYIINKNFVSRIQFGKSLCSVKKNNYTIPFTNRYIDSVESMSNSLSQFSHSSTLN